MSVCRSSCVADVEIALWVGLVASALSARACTGRLQSYSPGGMAEMLAGIVVTRLYGAPAGVARARDVFGSETS